MYCTVHTEKDMNGCTAGPAAQKVLAASQYKVSPHRNIKEQMTTTTNSKL